MPSVFPANKQTSVGLLIFLFLLWTLSTITNTNTIRSQTNLTNGQSEQWPAKKPVPQSDSQPESKPEGIPGSQPPFKTSPPPDAQRPGKTSKITPPAWNAGDGDKTVAKVSTTASKPKPLATSTAGDKGKSSPSSLKLPKPATSKSNERPLILYAFAESESAHENLKFFVKQGLHDGADFVFILNGETTAASLIPKKDNIKIVERPNTCFDLGAYGQVLRKDDLYKKYKRFITLNASVRGPFLPLWGRGCWSDLYLDRITDKIKLVGMTANCWPRFHVQSMIWATDDVGIDVLLHPPASAKTSDDFGSEADPIGMNGCYNDWNKAVHAEIGATSAILKSGFEVDVLMTAFHGKADYIDKCDTSVNGDVLFNGKYFGTNVHPYETIFIKANRDIDPTLINRLTEWQPASGFDSYSACSAKK